jgi:Ca-activated chloride channel family protein
VRIPGPFVLVLLGLTALLSAQSVQAPAERFKTGIDVVTVTATVVTAGGQLASGLTRDDFEIYDDGQLQTVTHFTSDRVPVSLGLLLDSSDSMRGQRIVEAREAVGHFLFDLLGQDDQYFVMSFNHQPTLLTEWSGRVDDVQPRLERIRPSGGTSIYDAVMAALPLFETRSRQRAALVVISDGADTASDATVRDVRSALMRSDAFVYAIAIDSPDRTPINRRVNPYALREMTDDSGGRTEVVTSASDLGGATARIAEELNRQYVLGFTPRTGPDGRYHSLRVRVKAGSYRVRARRGYMALRKG